MQPVLAFLLLAWFVGLRRAEAPSGPAQTALLPVAAVVVCAALLVHRFA